MMQDEHGRLNPGLPWQEQRSTRKGSFHQQIRLKFKEELEKCFIWCTTSCCAENWILRKAD